MKIKRPKKRDQKVMNKPNLLMKFDINLQGILYQPQMVFKKRFESAPLLLKLYHCTLSS